MSADDRDTIPSADAGDEVIEIDTVTVSTDIADDETGQIRDNIERTRADMSETIDAIQDKLNPQRMAEQVTEQVREATIRKAEHMVSDVRDTARDAGFSIVDTLRDNPLPAALAALGLGWLWMKRPSSDRAWRGNAGGVPQRRRYGGYTGYGESDQAAYDDREYRYRGGADSYGDERYRSGGDQSQGGAGQAMGQAAGAVQSAAGQVSDTVGQAAGQAGQTVQQLGSQVQDSAQQFGSQLQYRAQSARWNVESALQENPLGLGAIALAVGVAVGLAAPSTDLENQMLGDARDNLVQKAQDTAQDTMQKVQQVAQRTAETARDTAQNEAGKQGLTTQ